MEEKKALIDPEDTLSIRKQCELMTLNRSSYYLEPCPESQENLLIMKEIDKLYTAHPFLGSRKISVELKKLELDIGRKKARRLMKLMGLEAIYRKPKLSIPGDQPQKYPYLLRGLLITHPNQAWGIDFTYIPMPVGFMYLVAIIDWYSRYIIAWKLSNSMDISFCLDVAKEALITAIPEIMNSDQGSQFTSAQFIHSPPHTTTNPPIFLSLHSALCSARLLPGLSNRIPNPALSLQDSSTQQGSPVIYH